MPFQTLNSLRRRLRDALPAAFGLCLTLRANPLLGLVFKLMRQRFHLERMVFEVPLSGQTHSSLATYWFSDYEAPERELSKRYIKPNDRVCELGGCLGIVSMVIQRQLAQPHSHLVVEANPALLPLIERNRALNGGQFTLHHAAVGNGQPLTLDISSGLLSNSTKNTETATQTVTVAGCTLDALNEAHGGFDVLVMDIEGAEREVILGESQSWRGARLIIAEWHPSLIGGAVVEQIRTALTSAGFRLLESHAGDPHTVEAWEKAH